MKKTERTKKALSGLLALSLALGCLPMPAHAQEEKLSTKSFFSAVKQQEDAVETSVPTEPTVPETTAPAEPTEPAVPETTAPVETVEATEPVVPETTVPAEPKTPVAGAVKDSVAGSVAQPGQKIPVDFLALLGEWDAPPVSVIFQNGADINLHDYLVNAYGLDVPFTCEPATVAYGTYADGETFRITLNAGDGYEGSATVEAEVRHLEAKIEVNPKVTYLVAQNANYADAVGKQLLGVSDYGDTTCAVHFLKVEGDMAMGFDGVFRAGDPADFTIRVMISCSDYIHGTAGWSRQGDGKAITKDFTFHFQNSPYVDLPNVEWMNFEWGGFSYIPKKLSYTGQQQSFAQIAGFDKGTVTTESCSGTDVGTYTAKVKVVLNSGLIAKSGNTYYENYTGIKWQHTQENGRNVYTKTNTVTITPVNPKVTVTHGSLTTDASTTYSPEELYEASAAATKVEGIGNDGTLAANITYTWSDGTTGKKVPGSTEQIKLTITPTGNPGKNYNSIESTVRVDVTKKVSVVSSDVKTLEYDGTGKNLASVTLSDSNASYAISYQDAKGNIYSGSMLPVLPGEYSAYVQLSDGSVFENGASKYFLGTAKITKRTLEMQLRDQTITYGENLKTGGDAVSITKGSLLAAHTLELSLTPSTTDVTHSGTIEVGEYKILDGEKRDVTAYYSVSIRNNAKLVIKKRMPQISFVNYSDSYTFNAKILPAPTAGQMELRYASYDELSFQWEKNGVAAEPKNVGTYTLTATFAGDATRESASAAVTVTIKEAALNVEAKGYSGSYDAQPHGITVTAQGVDQGSAAIRYGLAEGTYELAESPTRTEAGTTTVYYQIEQENHATVTGSKSIIIAKATPTADLFNITLPEKAVYDGTSTFAAKVTVKDGVTGLGTAVLRYNGGVTPQAAGSYTVTAVVEEGTNYTAGEVSLGSFTVAAADNAWTTEPSIEGWTYGETCQSLTVVAAAFGTPEVRYVGTTNAGVSYDSDVQPDQAGEYKAVFTVRATSDYDGLTKEVLFTVKRAAGLKAEDFTFTAPENLVYTGDVKTAGIVPKAGLTGVGAITQHVSPKATINVGTYTVAIDVAQGANYEASTGLTGPEWTFTITKAQAPAVSMPIATIVYGQSLKDAQFIDPTWKWVDDTIVPLVNGAYSAWLAVDDENYDYTGVAGYVDETDSITWDAWVSVSAATPAITITTDPGAPYYDSTVSVEAKAANPYNETFTDAPVPNLLYKIGDNPWAAFDGTLDLSAHTAPVGTVVSFKAVTVAEGQYTAAEKEITVTVVEKPQQTITCGEIVKTYGDKPFTMGAASNSGTLSYTVSTGSDIVSIDEEGTITILNAGTAVITVTAAETAGYAQTSREFTVTVKPKTITAAPKAVSVACSTDVPALEIGYTGLVGSDSVAAKDFDLRLFDDKDQEIAPAEAIKKPGTYTIRWMNPDQVSFAELTNYVVTKVETANFVVFVPYVEEAPARKPAYVPPKIVEVPISGEEETIRVNATVKGSTAALEKVNDKQMHEVIGSHVETGTVTIDFSELKQKIDTVVLHTETIQQIAEAAHDAGNDTEALEIRLSNDVSIEFCAESLAQKVEQAKEKNITISIIPGYKDKSLSREQKQAIGNRPSYSVIVTSGEERLTDLGGEMTIRAPYKLKYGENPEGLVVYRVAEDGTREKCETSYDSEEKLISWKTDSLALYIIAYEAP